MFRPATNTGSQQPRSLSTPQSNNCSRGNYQPQQPRNANHWQPQGGNFRPWGTQQQQPTPAPRTNNGPVPMDIDAAYQAQQCFRCGDEGHISRDCTTSIDVIRQRFGRNSMIPPPRPGQPRFAPAQRVRAAEFANAAEFVNAMTQEQVQQLAQAMAARSSSTTGSSSSGSQGFASGSS